MSVNKGDDERPLAWTAILANTAIESNDGQQVGRIVDVVGAEDIFHGVEVSTDAGSKSVLIPAEHVTAITNQRVRTDLEAESIRQLPVYVPEESYHLGFVGLIRKRLGWTDEGNSRE
ncbi:MAG: hypothetical protein ACR2GA_02270 [Chloroflexota bacterium]